jgi:O-antigen/teichoic acid export membrane protein
VLGMVAGTAVVAVYAIAIQLQMYYMSFSTAVSSVFLPRVTAMVAQNKSEKEVSDLFIRTGRIQYVVMAFICSGFILFGKSFIVLWAGANYSQAYYISLLLMIPFTFPLIQNLGITILQARNQQMFRSVLYVIVAACSLAISIPLAKLYGGIGCAIGTSFALITGNIIAINIYYYKRIHIDIPLFWKEIFKMSIPVAAVTIVGLVLNYIHSRDTILSLGIKIIFFSLLYFPLIWWKGINNYERELFGVPIKRMMSKSLILLKIKI